jgi:uncharacterized protein
MLPQKVMDDIVPIILRYYDPEKIILFGSYAKNTDTSGSDIDLLIIKDTPLPKEIRGRELHQFFFDHIIRIDFHFYTNQEFEEEKSKAYSFAHSIDQTGRVIYEKSGSTYQLGKQQGAFG